MPAASAVFAGLYTVACTLLLPVRYHLRKMQRRSDAVPLPPWLLRTAAKLRHPWAITGPTHTLIVLGQKPSLSARMSVSRCCRSCHDHSWCCLCLTQLCMATTVSETDQPITTYCAFIEAVRVTCRPIRRAMGSMLPFNARLLST
jgi:hypothetical protein